MRENRAQNRCDQKSDADQSRNSARSVAQIINIQQQTAFKNDNCHRHFDNQTETFFENRRLNQAENIGTE